MKFIISEDIRNRIKEMAFKSEEKEGYLLLDINEDSLVIIEVVIISEFDEESIHIDVNKGILKVDLKDFYYKHLANDDINCNVVSSEEVISVKEYAAIYGLNPASVRQKCIRGGFKTAHKIGRDWFINKNEPNPDGRKRKS